MSLHKRSALPSRGEGLSSRGRHEKGEGEPQLHPLAGAEIDMFGDVFREDIQEILKAGGEEKIQKNKKHEVKNVEFEGGEGAAALVKRLPPSARKFLLGLTAASVFSSALTVESTLAEAQPHSYRSQEYRINPYALQQQAEMRAMYAQQQAEARAMAAQQGYYGGGPYGLQQPGYGPGFPPGGMYRALTPEEVFKRGAAEVAMGVLGAFLNQHLEKQYERGGRRY